VVPVIAFLLALGAPPASYVPAERCASCHPKEWEAWRGSDHDRAMEVASPSSVLGDFGGARFEGARFRREGETYFVDVGGESFRVRYTFGFSPLQQYLLELPRGRLQAFDVAWDVEQRRWFRLQPEQGASMDDPFHWSGRYQSWNSMCAECHSTEVKKRYDPKTDRYDTTFAEVDVGCQSCHGPGSRHVAWTERRGGADKGLLPVRGKEELERCAPCHSRRSRVSAEPIAGAAFHGSISAFDAR
jgi:hypothetical protein